MGNDHHCSARTSDRCIHRQSSCAIDAMSELQISPAYKLGFFLVRQFKARLELPLLAPIRAFRLAYLPLLTIYLASGALGLIAVADSFWVKTSLTLTPVDLAALAVWLQLPWSAKMVFSEFVDALPIYGSKRRAYTCIGAGLIAGGLVLLAGAAGGWIRLARPETLYVAAQLLVVIGSVIQEVVADAMSPEVVARSNADGSPRAQADINADLAMVEVLARLTYSIGAFAVGWVAGVLAKSLAYQDVFLIGLLIPVLSVSGAFLVRLEGSARSRPIDLRIFLGGLPLRPGIRVPAFADRHLPYVAPRDGASCAGRQTAHCVCRRHDLRLSRRAVAG
jgi:hypothetical protein